MHGGRLLWWILQRSILLGGLTFALFLAVSGGSATTRTQIAVALVNVASFIAIFGLVAAADYVGKRKRTARYGVRAKVGIDSVQRRALVVPERGIGYIVKTIMQCFPEAIVESQSDDDACIYRPRSYASPSRGASRIHVKRCFSGREAYIEIISTLAEWNPLVRNGLGFDGGVSIENVEEVARRLGADRSFGTGQASRSAAGQLADASRSHV